MFKFLNRFNWNTVVFTQSHFLDYRRLLGLLIIIRDCHGSNLSWYPVFQISQVCTIWGLKIHCENLSFGRIYWSYLQIAQGSGLLKQPIGLIFLLTQSRVDCKRLLLRCQWNVRCKSLPRFLCAKLARLLRPTRGKVLSSVCCLTVSLINSNSSILFIIVRIGVAETISLRNIVKSSQWESSEAG